eukprot:jgi/Galph1/686/GphlegSOOS_G5414.1
MRALYYTSSGAIPSTFQLGQRIINLLDSLRLDYERIDVFVDAQARIDLEQKYGKVQIPCLLWDEKVIHRRRLEQAIEQDTFSDIVQTGKEESKTLKKTEESMTKHPSRNETKNRQKEDENLDRIPVTTKKYDEDKHLIAMKRRLHVSKYLMQEATQNHQMIKVQVKSPSHATFLPKRIRLEHHLLCIYDFELNAKEATSQEMIPLSKFFLKRHTSMILKLMANTSSYDILFENVQICDFWWKLLLRTKRYLELQDEVAKLSRTVNDSNETQDILDKRYVDQYSTFRCSFTDFYTRQLAVIRLQVRDLEIIGTCKIGSQLSVRGWIKGDRNNIKIQWYRKPPFADENLMEPIENASNQKKLVISDDIGQQILVRVSWKEAQNNNTSSENIFMFLEHPNPVIIGDSMRQGIEKSILHEYAEFWVKAALQVSSQDECSGTHQHGDVPRNSIRLTVSSEKIIIQKKQIFLQTIEKFALSQLQKVQVTQNAESSSDDCAKCFSMALRNGKWFHIIAKDNEQRELIVMTLRAFRALHILGSRLKAMPEKDGTTTTNPLVFHALKKSSLQRNAADEENHTNDSYQILTQVNSQGTFDNNQQRLQISNPQAEETCYVASESDNKENMPENLNENQKGAVVSNDVAPSNEKMGKMIEYQYQQRLNAKVPKIGTGSIVNKLQDKYKHPRSIPLTEQDAAESSMQRFWQEPVDFQSIITKRIHWNKIPLNKIRGSIWQSVEPASWQVNESEMKALFSQEQDSRNSLQASKHCFQKMERCTLIDDRYARNVEILLGRFRSLSIEQICYSILHAQCLPGTSMFEFLPLLAGLVPSLEVQQQLLEKAQEMDATTFSKPEKLIFALCQIPRCCQKVQAILYRLQFKETQDDIRIQLERIIQGCDEICRCESLQYILELCLAAGNFLNSDHLRGNALGFSIEDLNLFVQARSTKFPKLNLLNYLICVLQTNAPTALSLTEELGQLKVCATTDNEAVLSQFEGFQHDLKQVHHEINQSLQDPLSQPFGQIMSSWYAEAEQKMAELEKMVQRLHESIEDTILYLPSTDSSASYNTVFQSLQKFVSDFQRAIQQVDAIPNFQKLGKGWRRRTEPKSAISSYILTKPEPVLGKSIEPPPPPPPPPILSTNHNT